jgi:glutathione peroxidase-family protein
MKKLMKPLMRVMVMFAVILAVAGCGKKAVAVDTKPFNTAIDQYCSKSSFGMKVKSFEQLKVDGDKATATCKMEEAGGTYGMAVKWNFEFTKTPEGWQVTKHTAK